MPKPSIVLRPKGGLGSSPSQSYRLVGGLFLLAALALLSSCGLKGDLYLPSEQPAATPAPAPTQTQQDDDAGTHS